MHSWEVMKPPIYLLPFVVACMGYAGEEAGTQQIMLSGTLGTVDVSSNTPELRELRVDENGIFLDLRIIEEDQALMVGLRIPRRINERGELEYMTSRAEMIGCAGPEDGEWDVDCEPDDLTVDVTDNEGNIVVEFEGTFHDCGAPPPPEDPGDPGDYPDPEDPGDPGDYPGDPPGVIDGVYLI